MKEEEEGKASATGSFSGKSLTDRMSQTLSGPMAWRKREHACVEGRQRPLPLFHVSFSYMHQHDCDAIAWPGASTVRMAERERKPSGLRPPALACVQEGGQEVGR